MKLSNNPEIRKFLAVTVIPSLLLCFITAFYSKFTAVCILILSKFLIGSFLVFTKKRYKRINNLGESIDKILHGNDTINIKGFDEGELSILESDVQKMLVRLRDQKDILEKERTFLADSIADISHQLRTPLTSINLILSLIESPDISAERREELLRELSSLITKTEHLVSVLLKISKLDAGTVQFEKKTTDLSSLLEKSAEPLLIPMDIKNQKLSINADDISLNCDFSWCIEAFGNILKNCTEHTPENGEITVTATNTPIFTEVIITDTGSGFNEEDIPHIFDRFYRSDKARTTGGGYGLGLYYAKQVVELHKGTISIKSQMSKGTTVTIKLPRNEQ